MILTMGEHCLDSYASYSLPLASLKRIFNVRPHRWKPRKGEYVSGSGVFSRITVLLDEPELIGISCSSEDNIQPEADIECHKP